MSGSDDIISFDLIHGKGTVLDMTGFFPLAPVHAIRSTKRILDTLSPGEGKTYDFSLSHNLSIKRFQTLKTLDLARRELFEPGMIATLTGEKPRLHTINLFPPLHSPYGALDVRGVPNISTDKRIRDLSRRTLPWSLHTRRVSRIFGRNIKKHKKPILATFLFLVFASVPILFYVKFLLESSYASLLSLKSVKNYTEATSLVHDSRRGFEQANVLFYPFRIIPLEKIKLASIAIDGGLALTRGVSGILDALPTNTLSGSNAIESIDSIDTALLFRPEAKDIYPLSFLGISEPTKWLKENHSAIINLEDSLKKVSESLQKAEGLSYERADEIAHIGRGVLKISDLLGKYIAHEDDILALLGSENPERFIVFNQNRDEIRANGGFPGSVITFTTSHGNLLDYRTDDVYYYDWNLYPSKEIPPPGLALLSDNFGLRDVNYYPDFRDTLEKANNFIERSGDATVTVGVAINQGIIENILDTIGPVEIQSGVLMKNTISGALVSTGIITHSGMQNSPAITFTSENFSILMSTLVEARYGEKITSKDALFAFIHALVQKINQKRAYEEVIDTIEKSVEDGEVLVASRDDRLDGFLSAFRKKLPWEQTQSKNWIYPVLTSLSGNKSDRIMNRTYTSETIPLGSCRFENKITLTHTHTFTNTTEDTIKKYLDLVGITDPAIREKMTYIQGKGKNSAFIRLYVPLGATLTGSTAGITTNPMEDKTELSFTLDTPIGATSSKILRYDFPIPDCANSTGGAVWYRQPGIANTVMKSR